jgi:NAD(P)-dependent dehydrogenase (short-subunit alcohol dehydrogenase family)
MGLLLKAAVPLAVALLAVAALPLYLSYAAGGWVAKYTSPTPFAASDIPDLSGKVAIVTGANTGIGLETARELTRNGAEVIVAARSASKGEAAVASIKASLPSEPAPKVRFLQLDLSSLKAVERFAQEFERLRLPLHLLVLNAGVMKSPGGGFIGQDLSYGFELSADGLESHIAINHLAHFHLTAKLLPKLKASAPARVVAVSSAAESQAYEAGIRFDLWEQRGADYEDGKAYGQSKLANLLFARELAHRLEGTGVTAYSCHPGIIETELSRHLTAHMAAEAASKGDVSRLVNKGFEALLSNAFMKPADGALTQLHLATSVPAHALYNGGFYWPITRFTHPTHPQAANLTLQRLLWEQSERTIAKHLRG